MAKSKVSRSPRKEQPVTEGIHRAAERIGVTPTPASELLALRKLATVAEHVFEARGVGSGQGLTALEILDEALRCAKSDFAVIGDAQSAGSGIVDSMVFRRAELRLDLALALAEYRAEFSVDSAEAAE